MSLSKEEIKELRQKNKSQEVIFEFVPNPNLEEEFLEFIEEVLNWSKPKEENSKEICQRKNKL